MKGVPWDHTLEALPLRRCRIPVEVRLPTIAEGPAGTGPGPDEAASDPPSTPPGAGADIADLDADMRRPDQSGSSSSRGSDSMSTDHSSELRADVAPGSVNRTEFDEEIVIPGGVSRVGLEEEMPTGHAEDENVLESGNVTLESSLEVDWRVEEGEFENEPESDQDFSKESSGRRYEDGPPQLSDEKLQLLDAAMDKVELNRLSKMGVLKELFDDAAMSGMMNLQSKFLLFNLPGQRAGARDFYDKLAGVMIEDGMESFKAAPALFIQPQSLGVSSHVDDLEILSTDERVEQLKFKLKAAGLNFSIEGPCTAEGGECHFLKRKFSGAGEGILVSQSGKHIEKLVELVGVQRAAGKSTPCPLNPND
eukprot:s12297_g1.t1